MKDLKKVISEKKIQEQLVKLAKVLNEEYKDVPELILVIVLTGANNFAYDLAKLLKIKVGFDFVEATSYKDNKKQKEIDVKPLYTFSLKRKNILIIEDIIESGNTIKEVVKTLGEQKPRSISIASLFSSIPKMENVEKIYTLFPKKPKGFLVGYGFDDKEFYRNLPYIAILKK